MKRSALTIEIALLGFLHQEPMHGYALHQRLSDPAGLGQVWRIKLGRLYAMLARLEAAGCLTASTELQENKPPRKIFRLTDEGRRAFQAWVGSPVRHGRSLRLEFLVKLFFVRSEGAGAAARLLAAQRARCLEWLAAEQEMVAAATGSDRPYSSLVHQFRSGQIEAMLDWLNLCAETLQHDR